MGYEMRDRLPFLEKALQGLAFWIGHRRSIFENYLLSEAALTAEACNLIQTNLPSSMSLRPECQYRHLLPEDVTTDNLRPRTRADLAIFQGDGIEAARSKSQWFEHVHYVMEVKLARAPKSEIDRDLRRLYDFVSSTPTDARGFLIVISESSAPDRFVVDGRSRMSTYKIPDYQGFFRVRRTLKAASAFTKYSSAHYVCMIEVFETSPRKRSTR